MFAEAFAPHVHAGREIVALVISARLSGTINAARAAAAQFPSARIHLFDSQTVSGGLALLVARAVELVRAGCDAPGVSAALKTDRERQRGYATLPDLSHALRTGRINPAMAAIGTLLRIVPVLRVRGGEIEEEARVRTFARAQEQLIDSTLRALRERPEAGRGARFVVVHSNALAVARALRERLRARLPEQPEYLGLAEAGPVVAVHAGQGAVGIFSLVAPV
jgi:DegV family protein with EDD domain